MVLTHCSQTESYMKMFTQLLCCFIFYIIFLKLLPYIISGPYTKWCYCHSHLTSSCVLHVVIIVCTKLTSIRLR